MAITHYRAQIIGATRSPVAAAAYRHRATMYDAKYGETWDYAGKTDLAHAEVIFPALDGWTARLAGTGKSTLLAAANRAWTGSGVTVVGASVSGIATRGLESAADIPSKTVAKWLAEWNTGKAALNRDAVFVLDEAGMIGSADMQRIVNHVRTAGAKLVLVGDPDQLSPIAAGAPLRAIIDATGHILLADIRRQRVPEHRAATAHVAAGNIASGLAIYQRSGAIHTHDLTDNAIDDLVRRYIAGDPSRSRIALAYTNKTVEILNASIRNALIETGRLVPATHTFETSHGVRAFSPGDRLLFIETKQLTTADGPYRVDNGALATVLETRASHLRVRLDHGRVLDLNSRDYNAVAHGYAATIHKSQGVTVDETHVLATAHMDRAKAYVAFSRHRHDLHIYEPQDAIRESLAKILSRAEDHPNSVDTSSYRERRGVDRTPSETERIAITRRTLAAFRAHLTALANRLGAVRPGKFERTPSTFFDRARAFAASIYPVSMFKVAAKATPATPVIPTTIPSPSPPERPRRKPDSRYNSAGAAAVDSPAMLASTCAQLARGLSNIRVSASERHVHLRLPSNAPTLLHKQLTALGAT